MFDFNRLLKLNPFRASVDFDRMLNWKLLRGSHEFPGPDGGTCTLPRTTPSLGSSAPSRSDVRASSGPSRRSPTRPRPSHCSSRTGTAPRAAGSARLGMVGVERAKALLGLHSSFDCAMILLQDVVQILDRSMAAAPAQDSFRLHAGNRRAVEAGLIAFDDAGLRMRWIAERPAEQAFGRRGIAQRRQQEVDGGTGGIDGPIKITPTAVHSNICFIDPP